MPSIRPNRFFTYRVGLALLVCAGAAMPGLCGLTGFESTALAQQTSGGRVIAFPTTIAWSKRAGVTKYRLQIAEDEQFSSVFYDGPVSGERYMVKGMEPGYYYWRIAPAGSPTGAFSKPVRLFVSGGVVVSGMPPAPPGTRPRLQATSKVR